MSIELTRSLRDYYPDVPLISTPGRILVQVSVLSPFDVYRYDVDVLDYDDESAVFWINEGVGFDYWFDQYVDLELDGFYVIEGVAGEWIRGDGWSTDDDEEWELISCRRATSEELETCLLPQSQA